jgi:hypothetical protein
MNTHGNAPRAGCVLYRYVTHPASAAIALVVIMFGCFVSLALAYPNLAKYPDSGVPVYVRCGSDRSEKTVGLGSGGSMSASGGQVAMYCLQVPKGYETFTDTPEALRRRIEAADAASRPAGAEVARHAR